MEFELLLLCSKQRSFKQKSKGHRTVTIKEEKHVNYIHLVLYLCIYTTDTANPEQKPAEELKASTLPEQLRFRSPKASLYIFSHWGHWHCLGCPSCYPSHSFLLLILSKLELIFSFYCCHTVSGTCNIRRRFVMNYYSISSRAIFIFSFQVIHFHKC